MILKLENIKYKDILKDINFEIKKTCIFGVLGVNGSGKTVLAEVIAGIRKAEGNIIFNNKNINKLKIWERVKQGIAIARQNPAKIKTKVKDYLSITTNKPEKFAKIVGIDLEKNLSELSGGERKRLELASIISLNPKIAILDEIDSGIDLINIKKIKRILKKMKEKGITLILITHNKELLELCEDGILLCKGKIVKRGEEIRDFFEKKCKRCNNDKNRK